MDADKNADLLEQNLKLLGQRIRIDILKRINNNINPISYSSLQKEVFGINTNSTNFAFHLKALKKSKLVEQSDQGYEITLLGKKIVDNLISMEQILNEQTKKIMIRTSKYSTEPFDLNKVESYLIKEGKMDTYQAKLIAKEVSERLSKTNIEYLTTPLMREYINGVLLENGLEEIRHRLTRLGTPPSEVMNLFNDIDISPNVFLKELGAASSEQFLLLNLLPKKLSDLYLSSEIILLNLNTWSIKPIGLYIDSKELLDVIFRDLKNGIQNNNGEYYRLVLKFSNLISRIKSFFSKEIVIGNFDQKILKLLYNANPELEEVLIDVISNLSSSRPHLSLEFSNINQDNCNFATFCNQFKNSIGIPFFIFNYSDLRLDQVKSILQNIDRKNLSYCIFNHNSNLNSLVVDFDNRIKNGLNEKSILLDKILINLHAIALNSSGDDGKFQELLIERMNNCFELFDIKQKLIIKKIKKQNEWNQLISYNYENIIENSIKAVSFFGLNEAIELHCGIELDRTRISENFAIKNLSLMQKILKEKNAKNGENFILAQPHQGNYLKDTYNVMKYNYKTANISQIEPYIIRKDSSLSLKKKISVFCKMKNFLNGGSIFHLFRTQNFDSLDLIKDRKLNFKCV